MPDKPKPTSTAPNERVKERDKRTEDDEKLNSGEGSYYYDDAHGYEDFDPNIETDDDDK